MQLSWRTILWVGLIAALAACSPGAPDTPDAPPLPPTPGEQQVVDIAWQALEPNTSSHNRAAWELVEAQTVKGQEVLDLFEGEPVPGGCAPGSTPPENAEIAPNGSYWHVQWRPRASKPRPLPTEQYSPTAPPRLPEPYLYQAHFLIDARTGQVIARKLFCVIY